MNRALERLLRSSEKHERWIIGLMSGTSLDGLDIALCQISGSGAGTKLVVQQFVCKEYSLSIRQSIQKVFAQQQIDFTELTLLHAEIGLLHGRLVLEALAEWQVEPERIDCIASHGQTVMHSPARLHLQSGRPNATLQIGDGDHIAVVTGIPTISDFRQKHVAAGGEGAPLALYGDSILFSSPEEYRILLNIGGISNFTSLPPLGSGLAVHCTDVGPGNTLSDALCRNYFNISYDKDGAIARSGRLNKLLLNQLLADPFFEQALPKTTGPELFNLAFMTRCRAYEECSKHPEDLLRTAIAFTVEGISRAVRTLQTTGKQKIYVSGGGARNALLMELLHASLAEWTIASIATLGVDGDAKEAALFALLANETLCGSSIDTGAGPKIGMGKISLPD